MERLLSLRASQVARLALIACAATIIGLATGISSVLFPLGIPAGLVVLLLLLLLWVMPDLRTVPDSLTRVLVYPFVFSALCVPAYYTIIIPGIPWISIRRIFLICLAVPAVMVLAGSTTHRKKALDIIGTLPGLTLSLVIFIACFVFATITTTNVTTSAGAMSVFLTGWALPLMAVLLVFRCNRDITRMMALLCICNFFDLLLGAIEFRKQQPFLIYLLPSNVQSQIRASAETYATLFIGQGMRNGLFRAASTFNISLSWGEMAAMLAPIGGYFATHGKGPWARLFGIAGVVASLGAIVCSGSRGAYLGFFVGLAVYGLAWTIRFMRLNPKSIVPFIATLITSVGVATLLFAVMVAGIGRRYILGGGAEQGSTDARWDQWALARPKLIMRPWGYGPGTAPVVVNYAPNGGITLDSYFITGLIDYGIIGFCAWLVVFGIVIVACLRTYTRSTDKAATALNALGCSLIAFLIYRLTLSQQENMTTMCIVLGMALVTLFNIRQNSSQA